MSGDRWPWAYMRSGKIGDSRMTVPTQGETYSKLMEHIRLAQEDAAMMAHLIKAETNNTELAIKWLAVSENLKKMQYALTTLAMRKMS